jgi:hypothetical protein
VVSTTQYPHHYQEDNQHGVSLRKPYQESGQPYAANAYDHQYAAIDAVSQPPGWYLADAIWPSERREYHG